MISGTYQYWTSVIVQSSFSQKKLYSRDWIEENAEKKKAAAADLTRLQKESFTGFKGPHEICESRSTIGI